jgi:hypothetical protein
MASGCAVCAAINQCNFAFHNGPGQYCGEWYDNETQTKKPCCCPLLQVGVPSTCNMTPTQCKCYIYDTNNNQPSYNPPAQVTHGYNIPQHNNVMWHEASPLAPLIILLLITCCCFLFCSRESHHHNHDDGVPIASAVNVDADAFCPPENPTYKTSYGSTSHYHHHHEGGGGGGGNAVASGLGGFAIGALVGDLIGRNSGNREGNMPMFGSGNNDGGYDIIGDRGGNFDSGYDIQGDSGGGYDIQGDS